MTSADPMTIGLGEPLHEEEAQEAAITAQQAAAAAQEIIDDEDTIAFLRTEFGRRHFREVFSNGGFDVGSYQVAAKLSPDPQESAYLEAYRVEAVRKIWRLLRMVATGAVSVSDLSPLFLEDDQ